jgi:hypothetical protein
MSVPPSMHQPSRGLPDQLYVSEVRSLFRPKMISVTLYPLASHPWLQWKTSFFSRRGLVSRGLGEEHKICSLIPYLFHIFLSIQSSGG